ncbi:hypothetical protein FB451DRAFT_1185432 [Mycena latifolia]|nr:hypothetical protein FB451DRAFT_1185432 [Mycena latifolia]
MSGNLAGTRETRVGISQDRKLCSSRGRPSKIDSSQPGRAPETIQNAEEKRASEYPAKCRGPYPAGGGIPLSRCRKNLKNRDRRAPRTCVGASEEERPKSGNQSDRGASDRHTRAGTSKPSRTRGADLTAGCRELGLELELEREPCANGAPRKMRDPSPANWAPEHAPMLRRRRNPNPEISRDEARRRTHPAGAMAQIRNDARCAFQRGFWTRCGGKSVEEKLGCGHRALRPAGDSAARRASRVTAAVGFEEAGITSQLTACFTSDWRARRWIRAAIRRGGINPHVQRRRRGLDTSGRSIAGFAAGRVTAAAGSILMSQQIPEAALGSECEWPSGGRQRRAEVERREGGRRGGEIKRHLRRWVVVCQGPRERRKKDARSSRGRAAQLSLGWQWAPRRSACDVPEEAKTSSNNENNFSASAGACNADGDAPHYL